MNTPSQTPPLSRLAVLGAGKMGEALLTGFFASGQVEPASVVATARHPRRLELVAERFGVETTLDNSEAVRGAEVILLAVKPQSALDVLAEIAEATSPGQILVSIVAGLSTAAMEDALGRELAVVRTMPNTPVRLGCGMTAVCGGKWASAEQVERARALFESVGRALVLDEKYFDAVTGVSASGPAFLYIIIESLAEGGVKVGLPRRVATELAAQACLGSARMVLETGSHPALLKDEVTTPAGCTMDGILELEAGGLRVTLIKAIVEACRRSQELVEE